MQVLKKFFSDLVTDSIKSERAKLSTASTEYLIELLTSFSTTESLGQAKDLPTLALCYQNIVQSSQRLRPAAYKRMGDIALFFAGCFSSYVNSTGGITYYIDMGTLGYRHAASTAALNELSKKFVIAVNVLNSAMTKTTLGQELSIEQLFDLHLIDNEAVIYKLARNRAIPIIGNVDRS